MMDKKELIAKAKEAKSVEELLALARENNMELTGEQAKECYDRLHSSGELTDDDLEKIAGGAADEEWYAPITSEKCDPNYEYVLPYSARNK